VGAAEKPCQQTNRSDGSDCNQGRHQTTASFRRCSS
jgi:hypothetical protein